MAIYVNQTGYLPDREKRASSNKPGSFQVCRKTTGLPVYEGQCVPRGMDEAAGEEIWELDFTEVREPGEYFLKRGDGDRSVSFRIAPHVYRDVKQDMLKAFYYQRCGCALVSEYAGVYEHPACHTKPALVYDGSACHGGGCGPDGGAPGADSGSEPVRKDVTGGWHDAGDYGRYVTPGAVACAHLMYAYELFPECFSECVHIPESGNGVPDVLNECRYELEWLLKMQEDSGGVYHKLTSFRHANFVMPQEDCQEFLIFPASSMATADFAAVMAQAARVYEPFDRDFADRAWSGACKAFRWLMDNPEMKGFENPNGCNTGPYDDISDLDERFWAAAEMLRTGRARDHREFEEECGKQLEKLSAGKLSLVDFGWTDVSGLAALTLLFDPDRAAEEETRGRCLRAVAAEADRLLELTRAGGFETAMEKRDYVWGSNMVLTNRGMLLAAAAMLTGDKRYEDAAISQLHYLLGRNASGYSYVTGHGEKAFQNPHNRPTVASGLPAMPGWVSGGANANPGDEKAEWLIKRGAPPMKCYLDLWECYSLNEITIYWNSSALFLAAFFDR